MMIPGYCERCHRFRRVRVTVPVVPPVGVCRDCAGGDGSQRSRQAGTLSRRQPRGESTPEERRG